MDFPENSFRKLYTCGRYGHGPGAKIGFRTNTFADFERALKKPVEYRAGSMMVVRGAIRFAHLTQNFGLAEHHGVQPGRNAKQVTDGGLIVMMIKRVGEGITSQRMKRTEERRKRGRTFAHGFRRHAINFTAIA